MKVEVNEKPVEQKYPYIGKWDNNKGITLIVFFYEYKKGIVLASNSDDWKVIGEKDNNWSESQFTPFTGSITLSND